MAVPMPFPIIQNINQLSELRCDIQGQTRGAWCLAFSCLRMVLAVSPAVYGSSMFLRRGLDGKLPQTRPAQASWPHCISLCAQAILLLADAQPPADPANTSEPWSPTPPAAASRWPR